MSNQAPRIPLNSRDYIRTAGTISRGRPNDAAFSGPQGYNAGMMDNASNGDSHAPRKNTRRRRWFQFSLRSLLIFTMICAVACGWLGSRIEKKRKEREAVEAIIKLRGNAYYDYELDRGNPNHDPPGPEWLRKLLGENLFSDVSVVLLRNVAKPRIECVEPLTQLHMLRLDGSNVTDADLARLEGLINLDYLELSGTKVTDDGLEHLTGLSKLQELRLNETAVSDIGLIRLKRLTQLRELSLCATKVTDNGLMHLKGMTNLKGLLLMDMKITDAGLANLESLTQLEWLWLARTDITDAGLEHLKGMTQLQELVLHGTNITDAGLESLKGLAQLQTLNLGKTHVTGAGVANLQKALPKCNILTE